MTRAATDVVVVGVGRMGLPIARRLIASGARVHVVDIDPPRRDLAAAGGATASARLSGVADATAVITALPHVQAFEDVAFAGDGLAAQLRRGCLWIDVTSNDPQVAQRAADAHTSGPFVGAPMGGGPREAAGGGLTFWVGAETADLERAQRVLTVLARPERIHHVGASVGDGYLFKLLSNALWFGQVTAVSESLAIATRSGIPPERFTELLGESAARSAFTDAYLSRLIAGDYIADFAFASCVEELDLVHRFAREAGLRTPAMDAVREVHHRALEQYGAVDGEMLAARIAIDDI